MYGDQIMSKVRIDACIMLKYVLPVDETATVTPLHLIAWIDWSECRLFH